MRIQFNAVGQKARSYKATLIKKISSIVDSGNFFHGKENKDLIRNLEKYLRAKGITLTSSGHDSLLIALNSLHLKNKDEIIFPINAYPTYFPIAQTQARPVPVDVDKNGLINVKHLAEKVNKNTRAVVIVHLFGLVVDIEQIKKIIRTKKIVLIEDCAQAFGSYYKKRPVGTMGDIACFSFYPTKNLSTLGDGGALFTRTRKLQKYFQMAVTYGEGRRYDSQFVSGHSRLSEIQASVLNTYIKDLKKEIEIKRKIVTEYIKQIRKHDLDSKIRILYSNAESSPNVHLLVCEVGRRNSLKKHLEKKNIATAVHYPKPVHLIKAYVGKTGEKYPMAERLSRNTLSLPFHPYLSKKQIQYIVKAIKDFYV